MRLRFEDGPGQNTGTRIWPHRSKNGSTKQARLFEPKHVYWCDGSEGEARRLIEMGMSEEKIGQNDIFRELNQKTWPKSYLHRSHPTDVARTEQLTFVCHPDKRSHRPQQQLDAPEGGQGAHDPALHGARCAARRCTSCPT